MIESLLKERTAKDTEFIIHLDDFKSPRPGGWSSVIADRAIEELQAHFEGEIGAIHHAVKVKSHPRYNKLLIERLYPDNITLQRRIREFIARNIHRW